MATEKGIVKNLMNKSVKIITELKNFYDRPRPDVLAKKMNIKLDMMDIKSAKTPAYPSGHTAQGYLIALVLSDKHPKGKKAFMKLAKDISDSRNMAKVHYKSDSVFGKELGEALYKHIALAILSTRANTQEYLIARLKKEKFAATRLAKIRLSNLKSEELTQVMRGKSKIIKH